MKKLLLLLLFCPLLIHAQIIRPDSSRLSFGVVNVGDIDSLQLNLNNTSASSLNVTNIKFYTIYGINPFSASENSFVIPANGSYSIWVYFAPEQNILHNTEMVIQHNASSGVEAIDLLGQGRFPLTYYNSTENLSEQALKNALKTRLGSGYVQLSYNAARDAMFLTIDNKKTNGQGATVNTLECVYTGYNKTNYTSRSHAQTTSPQFNTEHTFPQGFFNQSLPMRSDIHHLYPTTNNSNSQRGNKPFGTVSGGTPVTLGGGSFYNSTTFEPRNAQKGITSRAMMYFVIRYQDYSSHFSVQQNILRNWHNSYPVTAAETKRNNDIFAVQGNRNPFVDYPQLEERITNFIANSVAPAQFGLDVLQTSINFGSFLNQQPDTFDYVMVNRGNQVINFSNFALSNSSILSFAAGSGTNTSINPGDAIEISVIIQTQNGAMVSENLTFNTNIPGSLGSFTIPINGSPFVVSLNENDLENQLEVFPNPLQDQLFVKIAGDFNLDLNLMDATGRLIDIDFELNQGNNFIISTESLSKGVYFLEITNGNKKLIKKLIK